MKETKRVPVFLKHSVDTKKFFGQMMLESYKLDVIRHLKSDRKTFVVKLS